MGIDFDLEKCTGCGNCIPACPFGLLEIVDDKVQLKEGCTLCGACRDACSYDAITIEVAASPESREAIDDYRGIWVFAEQHRNSLKNVSFELLAKGRELADTLAAELCAVCFGHDVADTDLLFAYGADKIYLVDSPELADNQEDYLTYQFVELIREYRPEVVLAGATALGRSFVPRVAAILDTGLTADCTGLDIDTEKRLLLQTRPTFGGNIMATIICPANRPQMATVRPRVFKKGQPDEGRKGEVIRVGFKPDNFRTRTKLLEFIDEVTETIKLEDADIIVSGGRGLGKPENFKLLAELAEVLGAALGASRATVDRGGFPTPTRWGRPARPFAPSCISPAVFPGLSSTWQACRPPISSSPSTTTPMPPSSKWLPTASSATFSRLCRCLLRSLKKNSLTEIQKQHLINTILYNKDKI